MGLCTHSPVDAQGPERTVKPVLGLGGVWALRVLGSGVSGFRVWVGVSGRLLGFRV